MPVPKAEELPKIKGPEQVEDRGEKKEGQQVESPADAVEGLRTAVGAQEGTFQGEAQEFGSRAEAGLTADEKGEVTAIQGQEHALSTNAQEIADAIARGSSTMNENLAAQLQTDPKALEALRNITAGMPPLDVESWMKAKPKPPTGDVKDVLARGNRLSYEGAGSKT